MFKVSLPLTEGSVLLQRTSFSRDRVLLSTAYEPPPSSSPLHRWTGTEGPPVDSELHGGEGDGSSFGSQAGQEDACGEAAEGNQEEADGDFVQAVRPDNLRVANVLSSLADNEGSDGGSEEGQNWTITRTVWLAEPPQTQEGFDGAGEPLPRSLSEPVDDDPWSSRLEHSGDPTVSLSSGQNPERTTSPGQPLCYYQQYQYMALGGASVQKAAPCSDANNINAPLLYGRPLAAPGGTAAEPQPTDYNHQWQSVMSVVPFGLAPQGHATPAAAWCQTWGPGQDQASQIGPAPSHYQPHHAVMWTLR